LCRLPPKPAEAADGVDGTGAGADASASGGGDDVSVVGSGVAGGDGAGVWAGKSAWAAPDVDPSALPNGSNTRSADGGEDDKRSCRYSTNSFFFVEFYST
jgi:hypothetical protein